MRRHLGPFVPILLWAEDALAHGGEILIVFLAALAIPLVILVIFLFRWGATAAQKAIVLLAYFGSYFMLGLLTPAMDPLQSAVFRSVELAIPIVMILLVALPLLISLAVARALSAKPNRRLHTDAERAGSRPPAVRR
jgi:hypothetical protein